MCPSAKPCSACQYPFIDYVVKNIDDETMRLCRSCFMSRCFEMVIQQQYPSGASMDEFRLQILDARIPSIS